MKPIFLVCTCLAAAVAVVSAAETSEAESREGRFIAGIVTSTTMLARLRSTTVTRPVTCLIRFPEPATGMTTKAPPTCIGRRKRRHTNYRSMFPANVLSSGAKQVAKLDSSMTDVDGDGLRKGKFLLFATRLVTSMTDFTTTFTSTDASTTVSVLLLCTGPGIPDTVSFRICEKKKP